MCNKTTQCPSLTRKGRRATKAINVSKKVQGTPAVERGGAEQEMCNKTATNVGESLEHQATCNKTLFQLPVSLWRVIVKSRVESRIRF